ncbi:hypothetical protein KI387_006479, partial [Taxus chinensis]
MVYMALKDEWAECKFDHRRSHSWMGMKYLQDWICGLRGLGGNQFFLVAVKMSQVQTRTGKV